MNLLVFKNNYAEIQGNEVRFRRVVSIDDAKRMLLEKGVDVSGLHNPHTKHPSPISAYWLLAPADRQNLPLDRP